MTVKTWIQSFGLGIRLRYP